MDTFGQRFRLEIFGASHAPSVGVTLSGVPASLPLAAGDFVADLLRRKSGAKGTTPRIEDDLPQIDDRRGSDGTLTITFANRNYRKADYAASPISHVPATPTSWRCASTVRCGTAGSPAG